MTLTIDQIELFNRELMKWNWTVLKGCMKSLIANESHGIYINYLYKYLYVYDTLKHASEWK